MKLKIALIRHGKTEKASASLSGDAKNILRKKCVAEMYPSVRHVYSSELLCCRETASLIYSLPIVILSGLDVPDCGESDGQAFPNAKMLYDVNARAINAIREIGKEIEKKEAEQCAIIVNKMVILAILRRCCIPRSGYVDWELPFGGGYLIEYDTNEETATVISKI